MNPNSVESEENEEERYLFWLSFCDPGLPQGEQLLGISIVAAKDPFDAPYEAARRNCNPGGSIEIMVVKLPAHARDPPEFMNILMSRAEAANLDRSWAA